MLGQTITANNIEIWYEGFGNKENPAFLLIMGACCQGILWPTDFCEKLAGEGFYVIRYDHRDAGASTCFDFAEQPYTQIDMMEDALGLLDALGIEKAHVFGLSSGGMIGQIMASHHPDRVLSLGLIATTPDLRPCNLALQGKPEEPGLLSSPLDRYLVAVNDFLHNPPPTPEAALEQRVEIWAVLNGDKVPLDLESERALHKHFLDRLQYPPGIENHLKAGFLSEAFIREAGKGVRAPTVIFQGTEDPIFPPDHGEKLAAVIEGSEYCLLEGHGHVPNPAFFDEIIEKLKENALR